MLLFWFGLVSGIAGSSLIILTVIVSLANRSKVTPWARKAQEETQALLKEANGHREIIAERLYWISLYFKPVSK